MLVRKRAGLSTTHYLRSAKVLRLFEKEKTFPAFI